jgi:hypothetical protein
MIIRKSPVTPNLANGPEQNSKQATEQFRPAKSVYAKRPQRQSQLEKMRLYFVNRPEQEISLLRLIEISGSTAIPQRIADLRHIGMEIENTTTRVERDGEIVNKSVYVYHPAGRDKGDNPA